MKKITESSLSDDDLLFLEEIIQYDFGNRFLLRETLHAPGSPGHPEGHRILAMVGNAVLRLSLIKQGREKNQFRKSIDLAIQIKASNTDLAKQGRYLGIDRFIVNNPSSGSHIGEKTVAATMEAIVGAVHMDCGEQSAPCLRVMTALGLSWPE